MKRMGKTGWASAVIAGIVAVSAQMGQAAPIVRLQFDNNLNDSGTAGITGITMGAHDSYDATIPPLIPAGTSLKFTPTADNDGAVAVTIPDAAALDVGSFTVTTWMQPRTRGLAGSGSAIYSRFVSNQGIFIGTSYYDVVGSTAKLRLIVNIDTASKFTDNLSGPAPVVTLNSDWVFVAFSYDATTSTGKTYFGINNGVSQQYGQAQTFGVGAPEALAIAATLGLRYDGNRAMDGRLDDFRIYGSALNAADVEQVRLSTVIPEPASLSLMLLSGLTLCRWGRS